MRQVHHWAALLFLASMVVHLARVFFTGAFRRPREINWMIGVTLLILAMINGFLGYSLIDDQLSGTGLRIMYGVVLSVPVVGTWIASLLFGGEFPGDDLIGRFYILHILIVPVIIAVLLTFHLFIVVRHKHTQFSGPGRKEDNVVGERMWPTYASKALGLFFLTTALLCLLGGLFQINPVWLFGPFDPAQVSSASQPDWYMGWLDGALRIMPGWETRLWGFEIPNPFYPRRRPRRADVPAAVRVAVHRSQGDRRPRRAPHPRPAPPAAAAHVVGRRHAQLLPRVVLRRGVGRHRVDVRGVGEPRADHAARSW